MPDARWAGPADKADVERLFMGYLALQGEPQDRIGFATTWRESLKGQSKFRFAVVGGKGVRVAAFATVHDTYSTHASGRAIRLEDLFVDPDHAGQGYRQAIVMFVEDYARRHKAKHVDVFLHPETALDPDFLPRGFEPLPSPPFRKTLHGKRLSGPTHKRAPKPAPRPVARPRGTGKIPSGQDLTELFR